MAPVKERGLHRARAQVAMRPSSRQTAPHAAVDRRGARRAHRAGPDVRDGRGRDRGDPHPHVEARPAVAARGARAEPRPRRPRLPRLRGRALTFDGALPRRSPRSPTGSSTTSACARATGSPSPCATSPSGRSRSGRRPRPARSSCRSTRGGRADELEYGLERLRRRGRRSSTTSGSSASPTHCRRSRASRRSIVARAPSTPTHRPTQRFEDVLGDGRRRRRAARRSSSIPRTTPRSSTRRARPGARRARSAPTATSARNLMSLAFGAARAGGARRRPDAATPPQPASGQNVYLLSVPFFHATGCHSVLVANLAFGGKIVIMHKWDAGAGARADRARADHDLRRRAGDGVAGARVTPTSRRATSRACSRSATAARPPRPSSCGASRRCSPAARRRNGYGLTETSSVTTLNSGVDYLRKPDSVGVPVAGVRREGRRRRRATTSPTGEVGELWIQGPERREGLLEQARGDRAERSRDGWLHERRRRPHRRRGLRLHRRPRQGHGHPRRRERLLRRGRGRAVRASRRSPTPRSSASPTRCSARRSARSCTLAPRHGRHRGRAAGARRASAWPRSRCPCASGSATSRCPATPPARSSSATCDRARRRVSLANRVDAVHAEFRRRSALSRGGEVVADGGLLLWAGPTSRRDRRQRPHPHRLRRLHGRGAPRGRALLRAC